MKRTAVVQAVGAVSYPPDGRPVWQVDTDLPDKESRSFYLHAGRLRPAIGHTITWGTNSASWGEQTVRKVGYLFDPDDVPDSPAGHHG